MYWFRNGNPLALIPWLFVFLLWWLGGWLVASHLFRLERHERLGIGFGLGLVGYLWFANLLGHWFAPEIAFFGAGLAVFVIGVISTWTDKRPWFDWGDVKIWPGIVAGLVLLAVFLQISRGLTIFDEPKNLTITSLMATGDIPPHYYMNASYYFRYHYGFQILGSTLMRLGGMFPWSASDVSKSIVFAYALLLGSLLSKRYIRHLAGIFAVPLVLAFASGTRYLLLLLPAGVLQRLDPLISLQGTSANINLPFSQALFANWTLDGGPPRPFPFAFLNGIFPPLVMAHAGSYALSVIIIGLILLLAQRQRNQWALLVMAVLFAMWGLTWESSYGLFAIGVAIIVLINFYQKKFAWKELLRPEAVSLALSVPLVILQGGTITEIARKMFLGLASAGIGVEGVVGSTGFKLRWPPAVVSAHLGSLELNYPLAVLVAICEIGLVILFIIWISRWSMQRLKNGEWAIGALNISAWVGLIIPLILVYQAERDISRFLGHSLLVWTLFLCFVIGSPQPPGKIFRLLGSMALILMMVSGVVVFYAELSAVPQPVLGLELTGMDARVARDTWNHLTEGSQVFDPGGWRASTLTGLKNRAAVGNQPTPEWLDLYQQPNVDKILAQGYRYVYLDDYWWQDIPSTSKESLSSPCVQVVAEYWDEEEIHLRRLLDLENCP